MIRLSNFVFFFKRDNTNFIYNSRTNSFYKMSDDVFDILNCIKDLNSIPEDTDPIFLDTLRAKKILTTVDEDKSYIEWLKLGHLSQAFSNDNLGLTIVPTISCNLSCPYCFEQTKPSGLMENPVIEQLVSFIKNRAAAKKYSITWFGGEPLLGLPVMKTILQRLRDEKDLTISSHSIITNGTLLNSDAISLFEIFPLNSMQITLDGHRDTHNSKRFFKSGGGTFDKIIENVLLFIERCPSTHIDIRVNIDNRNREEYLSVCSYLSEKFHGGNVNIYPGILRANKGCEDETFFSSADHLEFSKMLWKNRLRELYPSQCNKGCCATSISQFVIGPRGEIYVCWEHVGKDDKIMGYIDGKPGTCTDRYSVYKLKGHCFEDPKCLECGLLPLCSGGCPDKRVSNILDNAGNNLCCVYGENDGEGLEDTLYEYYKSKIN